MNTLLKPNEILEIVNANYSLGSIQSCNLIRRGFNDHYLISLDHEEYIFRVYLNHKYYIETSDAFKFELDLLEHLHCEGVPVANALRTKYGELLGRTPANSGDRDFALFSYARGREISRDSISIEQSFQLGKAMANMHLSANNFHSKRKRYRLDFKYLVDEPLRLIFDIVDGKKSAFTSDQDKDELQNIIQSLGPIDELVQAVKKIDLDQDQFGIIHGDLHTGNVHFQDNELVIFDFDHCAYGWRAYDISICLFLPREKGDSMLRGYESMRPLSKEERNCLPVFSKLRRLWDIGDMIATETLRN